MAKFTPGDLRFSYDQENDVAYISLGEPRESVCETLDNGVVIKRDPENSEIVGLILFDMLHHFASSHPRPVAPGLKAELIEA